MGMATSSKISSMQADAPPKSLNLVAGGSYFLLFLEEEEEALVRFEDVEPSKASLVFLLDAAAGVESAVAGGV